MAQRAVILEQVDLFIEEVGGAADEVPFVARRTVIPG